MLSDRITLLTFSILFFCGSVLMMFVDCMFIFRMLPHWYKSSDMYGFAISCTLFVMSLCVTLLLISAFIDTIQGFIRSFYHEVEPQLVATQLPVELDDNPIDTKI